MRRVFQRVSEPHQRPRTCPPQSLGEKPSRLSQGSPQGAHHDNERKFLERRGGGVSPPLTRTVKVPIKATMELRGSGGEKRRHAHALPPPLPTSPRPPVATNPAMTGLQSENDRGRPTSLPATPRNEGFSYPGSDLARRRPSLRTKTRRYEEDDLPVFNNGIGGGPIQRYPILEDRYQPLFTGPPSSPTSLTSSPSRPYYAADAQQLKRSGRPEPYSNSRNS